MRTAANLFLRRSDWLWLILLVSLGVLLRLSDLHMVWLPEQGLLFKSPDAYYHLRRVMLVLMAPDQLSAKDLWRGLSHTEPCIWPLQYSWLMASWTWLLSLGQVSQGRAEWLVATFPVFVGVLTSLLVYGLARRMQLRQAWLAAFIYTILPKNIDISLFTEIDHTVSEMGALALILWCLTALAATGKRRWQIGLSLALVLCYVVWTGSSLYLGIVGLGLGIWFLGHAVPRLQQIAQAYLLAAGLLASFYPWQGHGLLVYDRPSMFQPLVLLACGLVLLIAAWWRSGQRKAALAACLPLAGTCVLLALPILQGMDFLWGKGGGYDFAFEVAELEPLLHMAPAAILQAASPILLVSPLLVLMLLRSSWSDRTEETGSTTAAQSDEVEQDKGQLSSFLVAFCFFCGLVLSWRAQRFLYLPSLFLPLLLLGSLQPLWPRLKPWLQAVLASSLAAACLYASGTYLQTQLKAEPIMTPAYVRVNDWLRTRTPAAGDWLKALTMPAYAVLQDWDKGHFMLYRAQRPIASDGFGMQATLLPQVLVQQQESAALRLLDQSQVRYLVLGPEALFQAPIWLDQGARKQSPRWLDPHTVTAQGQNYSLADTGSDFKQSLFLRLIFPDQVSATAPALQNLRLVYESPERVPVSLFAAKTADDLFLLYGESYPDGYFPRASLPPRFSVYERVAGALISGHGAPGSQGQIRVPIRTNTGREYEYVQAFTVDAQGHFRLRVPYGSGTTAETVTASGSYQLELGGTSRSLAITDADILQGKRISLP